MLVKKFEASVARAFQRQADRSDQDRCSRTATHSGRDAGERLRRRQLRERACLQKKYLPSRAAL